MLVLSSVWLVVTDPLLGIAAVVMFPVLVGMNLVYQRKVDRYFSRAQEELGTLSAAVLESFDSGALSARSNHPVHLTQRSDHGCIVQFQHLGCVRGGGIKCGQMAGIDPRHRRQRPVGQRGIIAAVGNHQRGIAQRHHHIAALRLRLFPPDAQTFQPLILCKRRHKAVVPCCFFLLRCRTIAQGAAGYNHSGGVAVSGGDVGFGLDAATQCCSLGAEDP